MPKPTDSHLLSGTEWQMTDVVTETGQMVGVVEGVRLATISFRDDDVSGSTGCNLFMGTGTVEAATVALGPLATTMMMCQPEIMVQERRILEALGRTRSWQLEDGVLRFVDAEGRVVLEARMSAD